CFRKIVLTTTKLEGSDDEHVHSAFASRYSINIDFATESIDSTDKKVQSVGLYASGGEDELHPGKYLIHAAVAIGGSRMAVSRQSDRVHEWVGSDAPRGFGH
ncbi:ATP synthase epsilon chain, partial [Striga asiatica]